MFPEGRHSKYYLSLDELQTRVGLKGLHYFWISNIQLNPVVAVLSKSWVYGRSLAGIAGSNSAEGMDVCILCVLCVVQVEAFATGWSIVQRSHLVCVSLSMIRCDSHHYTYDEEVQEAGLKKKGIISNKWHNKWQSCSQHAAVVKCSSVREVLQCLLGDPWKQTPINFNFI